MGKKITEFVCVSCKQITRWENRGEIFGKKVCQNCWIEARARIIELYSQKDFSPRKISKLIKSKFNLSIHSVTINQLLKNWKFPSKNKSYRNSQRWQDSKYRKIVIPKIVQKAKERLQQEKYKKALGENSPTHRKRKELLSKIESDYEQTPREVIRRMYFDRGMSFQDIGKVVGANGVTVFHWFHDIFDFQARLKENRTEYWREKFRLQIYRRMLQQNRIGPKTSAFLSNTTGQLSVLTKKEINQFLFGNYSSPKEMFYSSQNLLVMLAKNGNKEAINTIFENLRFMIWSIVGNFYSRGTSQEDLFQEGSLGLWKAIDDYNPSFDNFRSFAELCVRRQIQTALTTARRQKHIPLNYAQFFSQSAHREKNKPNTTTLLDVIADLTCEDPETLILESERNNELMEVLLKEDIILSKNNPALSKTKKYLSKLEYNVLIKCYIEGKSYDQIARELNKHVKAIDNAIQRAKKKIRKVFSLEDFKI